MVGLGDTDLASVRKYCARWDTGANPGEFYRNGIVPSMNPAAGGDCALEAVFMYSGTTCAIIMMVDIIAAQNILYILQNPTQIRGALITAGSAGIQSVDVAGTVGHWYHALLHWQDSGAYTVRVEFFVNGVSVGVTPYYGRNNWIGGPGSYLTLGDNPFTGRMALGRYFRGAPPPAADLYDLPYIVKTLPGAYANLRCQWDMSPGNGDIAYDSAAGIGAAHLFDIPWVGVDQPNALYSSYRYTGQCRGNLWTPP